MMALHCPSTVMSLAAAAPHAPLCACWTGVSVKARRPLRGAMSVDFRTVARTPMQHAPIQNPNRTVRRSSSVKKQLVGTTHSFSELRPFEMPLPTEDRRSHGDPARRRRSRRRPQSAQPFASVEDQHSSSVRLTSGGSSASLGELPPRPSTAPAQRRPASGSSVRARPSSGGGSRSATQRPWLDEQLRAGEGGRLIFAKLELLENATARNVPSERLSACSDLFDAVIRVDTTYGAVLQRVKQEYDDALGGGSNRSGGAGSGAADGTLAENYANLSQEYQSLKQQMDEQALESKILSEQYEIVLRQKERLAEQHEADQQRLAEQHEAIRQLENAAEMANTAAAQRRSMDLASVQISSTDHVHKLEQLVQELALELDGARNTEAVALKELVALRALLGEPDADDDDADWPDMEMAEREHSAAALQAAAVAAKVRGEVSEELQDLDSPLGSRAGEGRPAPGGGGGGTSSELSVEDAASIASTLGSGSELTALASSRPPVPRPSSVPSLDVSAASLELEGLTADGQALAAEREAAAQSESEALGQTAETATSASSQVGSDTGADNAPEAAQEDEAQAEANLTAAIEAVTSPKPLNEKTADGAKHITVYATFSAPLLISFLWGLSPVSRLNSHMARARRLHSGSRAGT